MELKPVSCGLFDGMCRDAMLSLPPVPGGLPYSVLLPLPSLPLCPCVCSAAHHATLCPTPPQKVEGRKAHCPGEETERSRIFCFNSSVAVAEQLWEECHSSGVGGGRGTWGLGSVAPSWTSWSQWFWRCLHILNHYWFVDLDSCGMF